MRSLQNRLLEVSCRPGFTRPGGMQNPDDLGFFVEEPESGANFSEGVEVRQGGRGEADGNDGDGLMGEIFVTGGLAHGASPVAQLHFEGADGGAGVFEESVCIGVGFGFVSGPGDGEQVGDAIAVDGDFAHHADAVGGGAPVDARELACVGPGKGDGEPILGGILSVLSGQVVPGFGKPVLGDLECGWREGAGHDIGLLLLPNIPCGNVRMQSFLLGCELGGTRRDTVLHGRTRTCGDTPAVGMDEDEPLNREL